MKSSLFKLIIVLVCILSVLLAVVLARSLGKKSDPAESSEVSQNSAPAEESSAPEETSAGDETSEEITSAEESSFAEESSNAEESSAQEESSAEESSELPEESSEEPSKEESSEKEPASKDPVEESGEETSRPNGSGKNYEQPKYITREEGKKYIAITFDDGPSSNTPVLLDFLEEKGYVVTFFSVGHRLESSKVGEYLTRAVSLGCEAAIHCYTHEYQFTKCSEKVYHDEVYKTAALVEKYAGYFPICMRPPYGSITKAQTKASEFNVIIWDVDSEDWQHTGRKTTEQAEANIQTIVDNVVNSKYLRDGSIILFHDLYLNSIEAFKRVTAILEAKGYEFVTVAQLMDLNSSTTTGKRYWAAYSHDK